MQTVAPISDQTVQEDYLPGAGDFFALLKPRVMSLVIFTAIVGMVMAPGDIHPVIAFTAILCIAVGAGAAGCLNMWYEADLDARMMRTKGRPIPSGRIDRQTALHFGVALSVASVLMMGLSVNYVAAGLLLMTILFYVVIYTVWLKRRTSLNIVIGGAAGAFPPMIAWAAVTGDVSLEAIVMFGIIFMWTPPHFWSLSLFACKDYKAAGIPMLPVVSGAAETRKQILIYTLLMVPLSVLPWFMGFAGPVYGVTAVILGIIFTCFSLGLVIRKDIQTAKRTFFFSIFYLFILFAVMGGEVITGRML
ncbi:Heme O synthase, protoheme IX farnesyltransferase COX10-CtaB [hydrothermal vent metagenome]|uniref:Protoheme IX farnesyltransferase n=1 Tax=hydrothermal vent metagenome TaxID=652676 RepID=A0A3B0SSM7_9ZZZZ